MQNCGISAGSPCDHLEFSNLAWHLSPLNFSNMNQANYTYFSPEKCIKRLFHGFVDDDGADSGQQLDDGRPALLLGEVRHCRDAHADERVLEFGSGLAHT